MSDGFVANIRALVKQRGAGRVVRYAFEAAATYIMYSVFRVLPLDAASALGGAIMRCIGPHLSRSEKTVLPQLAAAFPDSSDASRRTIMRNMWDNIGRVFAEYAHLDHIMSRVTFAGREHLEAARDDERPVIFVTGHIGNWEIASVVGQSVGHELNIVYRAPNNPWVEGLLRHARYAGSHGRLIPKGAAGARQILSVMRKKGAVGMLVDQRQTGSPLIPFFARPALTTASVFVFAKKFNARVHYVCIERLAGAHFRAVVSPEINIGDDETAYLTAMNAELESWIRRHPAQWLWTHRRWDR